MHISAKNLLLHGRAETNLYRSNSFSIAMIYVREVPKECCLKCECVYNWFYNISVAMSICKFRSSIFSNLTVQMYITIMNSQNQYNNKTGFTVFLRIDNDIVLFIKF